MLYFDSASERLSVTFSQEKKMCVKEKLLEFINHNYRVLMSVCVRPCEWCVCVNDNSKNNDSIHLELIVVYENSSSEFDIGHCLIKGQGCSMTLNFFSIYHNKNYQVLYLSFGTC